MVRYFIDIAYKGTRFHGWQIQPNAKTIQKEVEEAFSTLLKEQISMLGSGRTDAGVHAIQQIAHCDIQNEINFDDLTYKLNSFLDTDISINKIRKVKEDAHARFSATSRTYHYYIHGQKNPFKNERSYYFGPSLNLDLIKKGCEIIYDWKNFGCFTKVHTEVNHLNCDILYTQWFRKNNGHLFVIRANRFLRGMVRAIVGTLLEVGQTKMSIEELNLALMSGDRAKAGMSAPAEGLYLTRVEYPIEIFIA